MQAGEVGPSQHGGGGGHLTARGEAGRREGAAGGGEEVELPGLMTSEETERALEIGGRFGDRDRDRKGRATIVQYFAAD